MASQGSGARTKGSNFERKTAKSFGGWWNAEFHRTPGSGSLHWSSSNNVAGDVVTPTEANFPFVIECKDHKDNWTLESVVLNKSDVKNWWAQVVNDAISVNKVPMLVFKRNRSDIFIMLPYNTTLFTYLEENTIDCMITYVQFKSLNGEFIRYKVIVFTQPNLFLFKKNFTRTIYHSDWKSESLITKDAYKEIDKSEYDHIVGSLIDKL